MAGFVTGASAPGGFYEFHTDTPDVVDRIRRAAGGKRVVTLQLDGDELVAALWGIENYNKIRREQQLVEAREASATIRRHIEASAEARVERIRNHDVVVHETLSGDMTLIVDKVLVGHVTSQQLAEDGQAVQKLYDLWEEKQREVPVQEQLQYMRDGLHYEPILKCPNCLQSHEVYELSIEHEDETHGCHICGQKWRVDG